MRIFYKILADIIIILHFFWILFMLVGFVFTFYNVFFSKSKRFLNWWLFRIVHLCGIVYVGFLAVLGEYCFLTILENFLRTKYEPELEYRSSFIVHYIEKLVYPEINPLIILIPTMVIALFTFVIFIIKPPMKIKRMFKCKVDLKNENTCHQ